MDCCINLRERFGDRYRVGYEESYYAQYGEHARVDDPWLRIILCRHGHIYPQGGDMLAASTSKRGPVAGALVRLDCTTVLQDGSDGVNVAFHADHFEEVAAILKPRRKRQVSDEERARLASMGRTSLKRYRQANVEEWEIEPEGDQMDRSVPEAIPPGPRV
jgi:hypothetical protein